MNARRWLRMRWLANDKIIAAVFVLLDTGATLGGASWWPRHPDTLAWVMLAIQALAVASLVLRRRAPILVIAILTGFTLAISFLISPAGALTPADAGNVWAPYATVLAAYGPFYYCQEGQNRRSAFAAVAIMTLVVARVWDPSWQVITIAVVRTAAGPILALYFSARHTMVRALTERAERAERERYLLAEQARADERARLAGEMHDVVTHRVSLMVLQAGALGVSAKDEATRRAAEELRAAGVQALDELRDLVGILRTSPETDQDPSTAELAALVAESTAVGTPAELCEHGDPALASPVVGRTVYRIVREALTNVRKHAPGAQVQVQISYCEAEVKVTVTNTAAASRPAGSLTAADAALAGTDNGLAATGSGLGIAGLRQRIELVNGTLRAGPAAGGGFRLEATLPAYVRTPEPAA